MDCRNVVSSISEFIDDGLAADERRIVEEHLEWCASCLTIKQDLHELRKTAQSLPLHAPGNTLWLRVRAEAEAETAGAARDAKTSKPESWWSRKMTFTLPQLAGAGILGAAVLVSSGYLAREYVSHKPELRPRDAIASVLAPDLEETLKSQVTQFNQRKVSWDPIVRADFEQHLQEIDQSIEGCKLSLAKNPADQTQREMVRVLVDEKIRLLKDSSRLKW